MKIIFGTSGTSNNARIMPTDNPTVSVVVPTYYRNEMLRDAIESVREQRYPSVEIIVVDDSGERFAEPVVGEYNDVTYVAFDENRGSNAARTVGAKRAAGSYIQFLDDDDMLRCEKLSKQVALLDSNPEAGVAYCGQKTVDGERSIPRSDGRGDVLELALSFKLRSCVTTTMLVDAEVLDQILPLPNTPGSDDTYIKIDLSRITEFDFIPEPLVVRRDLDDSRGATEGAVVGTKRALEKYESLYSQYPPSVRQEAVATAYTRQAEYHLTEKHWSLEAVKAQSFACYHAPEIGLGHLGRLVGVMFGKPGLELAKRIYRSHRP